MILALLAARAAALQVDLPPDQLDRLAELVVVGEVTTSEARWAAGPEGGLETSAWIAVDQVVAGPSVETVEVLVDGGARGLHRTVASDAPTLHEDRRYRLRLVADPQGRWRVLGGERGAEALDPPVPAPLGFALNGDSWAWQELPVEDGFVLNTSSFPAHLPPAEVGAAWSLAVDLWNSEALAALYLPNDGTTTNLAYGGGDNGLNVTMFNDFDWGTALAASVMNSYGPDLIDCDTRIYGRNLNGTIDWSTDPDGADPGRYDLTHTVIHELGHCLGLSHSNQADAIMYAYNGDGTGWERRHLHPDDVAGIHALYGDAAVALSLEAELFDEGDGDGFGGAGEGFTVAVSIVNDTAAPTVDVVVWLASDHVGVVPGDLVELDDLRPYESATLDLPVTVTGDCADGGTAAIEVIAEDIAGNRWSEELELTLACPVHDRDDTGVVAEDGPRGRGGEAAGCGCATGSGGGGPVTGALLLPILALTWRRRRSGTRS